MQEIEIEFKNILNEKQYNQLREKWFNDQEPKKQTNYYFETDDFQLKNHQSALRIRKKNDQYIATLKQPRDEGLLETHDQLTDDEANQWFDNQVILKENIQKQLSPLNIDLDQINYKGELTTYRLEKSVNNFIVVLDYSRYNGVEDFELEIESPLYQEGKAFFEQILDEHNIEKQPSINKIQRFFNTLE
ncbi:CYTH domain-containing protein [Filobacillus milosensis]|uniref:CYTH domain-containing protein n=1 Tax=Filobacillus milosensis TaxID=94137 RepID=A0A4Y8IHU6_9BACI|nr:CYTH domain-containing protein [Filobacillus milosensis]TFB15047.1 CYTH domain-containing protein [Filobacillus milosensis]